MDWWAIEKELRTQYSGYIAGVDEAGRGPLAGPVFAAAVILPFGLEIPGLNDSKKLTAKKREELYGIITEKAVAWGVACASAEEIDRLNILNATYLAMNLAMDELGAAFDAAIIDGNRNSGIRYNSVCAVKGDQRSANVAAASVLAKVQRDRYMDRLDDEYPGYGFSQHKGYGTKLHYERLRELGPCPEHRMTFLRKMH